jgi:hypothetical protein
MHLSASFLLLYVRYVREPNHVDAHCLNISNEGSRYDTNIMISLFLNRNLESGINPGPTSQSPNIFDYCRQTSLAI